jgi:hypothetical protein
MKTFFVLMLFILASCNVFEIEKSKEKYVGVEVIMVKQDEDLFTIKKILDRELNENFYGKNLYRLTISKNKTSSTTGLSSNAFSSNIEVQLTVFYSLYEIETGRLILKSSVSLKDNYLAGGEKLVSEYMGGRILSNNISQKLAEEIIFNLTQP